jgi:hypothetical protein
MESTSRAERVIDQGEKQPDVMLLGDCERLATRWGGTDYTRGLTDGVELSRTVREFGDESSTSITFTANHVRPVLESGEHFNIKDFFTRYVLAVEVSREIDVLPPHIHQAAVELYGAETVSDAMLYTESHRIYCTLSSEDGYFNHSLDVGYSIDDHEIDFTGLDVCEGSDDGEEEDEGEGDYDDGEFPNNGSNALADEVSSLPIEGEFWDDDGDLSEEARLLNDAWELIGEGSKNLNYDNTPFDIGILINMARIDSKLEKREVKLSRLWAIAMLEIRNQQMLHCSNILKLFSPKTSL